MNTPGRSRPPELWWIWALIAVMVIYLAGSAVGSCVSGWPS